MTFSHLMGIEIKQSCVLSDCVVTKNLGIKTNQQEGFFFILCDNECPLKAVNRSCKKPLWVTLWVFVENHLSSSFFFHRFDSRKMKAVFVMDFLQRTNSLNGCWCFLIVMSVDCLKGVQRQLSPPAWCRTVHECL